MLLHERVSKLFTLYGKPQRDWPTRFITTNSTLDLLDRVAKYRSLIDYVPCDPVFNYAAARVYRHEVNWAKNNPEHVKDYTFWLGSEGQQSL